MNLRQLAVVLTKKEKGKKQVSIAQMSEIVSKLCEIYAEMSLAPCIMLTLKMRNHGIKKRKK